ncbi:hypothetical protein SDC9_207030 [bioreactor metagenome]|uniref:Uncharacterized protein n=1 Tax=bioreactor metagenome TaxID=1076179 RepID=A0A645J9B7_9ZZZZ
MIEFLNIIYMDNIIHPHNKIQINIGKYKLLFIKFCVFIIQLVEVLTNPTNLGKTATVILLNNPNIDTLTNGTAAIILYNTSLCL